MKRWGTLALIVVVLVVVVGGIKAWSIYSMIQGFKAQGIQKEAVSTYKVSYQQWRPTLNVIGSLRAVQGADLSPELAGIVDEISFKSGDDIKAGAVLVKLRAADDVARLDALRASAELAQSVYDRDKSQLEAHAISQAALDSSAANLKTAKAQVAEQQALVAKKIIRAPFSGHLGIRAVDPGEYVAPGTKLVTLQQLDPIYVDFTLPQQQLGQIAVGQTVRVHNNTYAGKEFAGVISAIDPKVDPDTRNVSVQATLKNPKHELLPGMFADVVIDIGEPQRYLTVPQTAIAFNPYGETVFVVTTAARFKADADEKAKAAGEKPADQEKGSGAPEPEGEQLVSQQAFVTVGPTRGDQIAILKGVREGDVIITSGQIKLKNGSAIEINNDVQPLNDPDPKPTEE